MSSLYISLNEAAQCANVSRRTIQRQISSKNLEKVVFDNGKVGITKASFFKFYKKIEPKIRDDNVAPNVSPPQFNDFFLNELKKSHKREIAAKDDHLKGLVAHVEDLNKRLQQSDERQKELATLLALERQEKQKLLAVETKPPKWWQKMIFWRGGESVN